MENESNSCPSCDQPLDPESIYCIECGTNVLLAKKASLLKTTTEIVINDDLVSQYRNMQQALMELSDAENIAETQKKYFEELDRQQFQLSTPINVARQNASLEQRDVEALKKLTWTSIKARVKGDKDEMLSKEEQEYFAAVGKHEALVEERDAIVKQADVAKKQWNSAQELVDKKQTLEKQLKALIKKIGEEMSHPIEDKLEADAMLIDSRLRDVEGRYHILQSNHSHALNALDLYHDASQKLDGAMNMSTWDLLGGGLIADSMKRSRLGDASKLAQRGNSELQKAISFLKDTDFGEVASVQDTGFWGDTFFDSIWTDMHARDKINKSQDSVNRAIREAGKVSQTYKDMMNEVHREAITIKADYSDVQQNLEEERIKLLESYMKSKN